ncbi:MAG: hypothetical protein CVU59_08915 [Deltaproteobacteria bacterium HGW-Deltaproteobacteria-17]|nr:MAG: hypothetical protein CVU59_08915 [Deltaproteobacteria bacterium HGW-Deltaproteobacteria-17]
MRTILLSLSILCFSLFSCDSAEKTADPPTELTIGTFNLQFLADAPDTGEVPRTAADLDGLVRLIDWGGFRLMTVQEVLSADSLALLQAHGLASSWRAAVGASGGTQKVGILYDTRVIERLDDVRELDNDDGLIPADWSGLRYPLAATVRVRGGFSFTLVCLHLKAGITDGGAAQRARQVEQLAAWAATVDGPLLMMGDLNDTFEGIHATIDTLTALQEAGTDVGRFLTADLPAGDFTSLEFQDLIDHVFLSPDLDARVVPGSLATVKFDQDAAYDGLTISDHRPVRFTIKLE